MAGEAGFGHKSISAEIVRDPASPDRSVGVRHSIPLVKDHIQKKSYLTLELFLVEPRGIEPLSRSFNILCLYKLESVLVILDLPTRTISVDQSPKYDAYPNLSGRKLGRRSSRFRRQLVPKSRAQKRS